MGIDESGNDRDIPSVDESGPWRWRDGSMNIARRPDVNDPAVTRRNRAILENANRPLLGTAKRHHAVE
jgi:hypothetical protein